MKLLPTSNHAFLVCFIAGFPLDLVDARTRYEGSGNCSEPCVQSEEFCGINNECIRYSCNNWYLFGPPEYTGHDGGSPILILPYMPDERHAEQFVPDLNFTTSAEPASLKCQADSNNLHSTGIIYGCSRWSCGGDGCTGYNTPASGGTGLAEDFTRRCEAINGQNRYVCYDMVGADNLQSFRSAAETFDLICTLSYDPNSTDFNSTDPQFIYQVTLGRPGLVVMAGKGSVTFNSSLVEIAMHAYVEQVGSSGTSSGGELVGMVGLWTVTATAMIGLFYSECFL